jgi:hypothetical protein
MYLKIAVILSRHLSFLILKAERSSMPEVDSGSNRPIIDFNSPKAAPTILTLGAVALRILAYWEDVDFILSVREEKIAMTLQLLFEWGWLALAIVGIVWALGAHKSPTDTTKVHWGMVTCVGILAFMLGTLITVHAMGSSPVVLLGWGGDPATRSCSAQVDTRRLVGLKDKERLILICGVADPTKDPIEDERIAVSQPFTITGQATNITVPYGEIEKALAQMPQNPTLASHFGTQLPWFQGI